MDTKYSPQDIEQKWYQKWERANYFAPRGNGTPYCIMLPPPNVTGSLHMGHGFQHTLMDSLSRYHRMNQRAVLWQPGTDHAGISTQMVVERQLSAQGLTRLEFEREQFVEQVWAWKEVSGSEITKQLRRMGSSVDWGREHFTMDQGLSDAVIKVFVQLYHEGLIYRGKRLVNWDPQLGTAISDLEVISEEEPGHLWHIAYPLADGSGSITIATTRPETMLGDSAVAVHPEDPRYKHLIGKQLKLPLCDRFIHIIGDEYVDPTFGSGCVKITPAHDFNDYQIGKRHHLAMHNIFNLDATLNHHAPAAYQGLDRFAAREKIIADLTNLGLLHKIEAHKLKVPRGEKSGVIIEPLLTDQWFVKIESLAKPAIAAVAKGEIKFVPETWSKTYFQWMENIEDWCISRQLWWGHRIPAWYDEEGKIYVGYSEDDVRFKYKLSANLHLRQDEDVLDTWFSAALWPFSTLGWPEKTAELAKFYPTNVLVTGFDIIFFWVARMIMLGLKFTGKVPFKEVYITGLVRDAEGKKMSKSKGNVLDPIDLIDGISLEDLILKRTANLMLTSAKETIINRTRQEFPHGIAAYGTDALRFTFCALASSGRDIRFDLGRVEGYRNFCNKIWNAARYVLMNTAQELNDWEDGAFQYSPADIWILSRLQHTIELTHKYFATYRFDLLANALYEFTWHEYCDWYLELSKPILYDQHALEALKRGTRKTLLQVLETIMRLLHPIMPFITEEIWRMVSPLAGLSNGSKTIMRQDYPTVQPDLYNATIEVEINWLKEVILAIRNLRSSMNISPAQKIVVLLNHGTHDDHVNLKKYRDYIITLAKLTELKFTKITGESQATAATALVGELEILIPLAGVINVAAESARLTKEIAKLQQDLNKSAHKLANPQYAANAPAEIVAKEREKLKALEIALKNLQQKLEELQRL